MKRILLAGIAAACCGVTALAADLPVKAPTYQATGYNWSGCYAGANVGYSWGRSKVSFEDDPLGLSPSQTLHPNGVIGGLQGGCNIQSSRNWVWGLETDFQWSGQKSSRESALIDIVIPGTVTLTESAGFDPKLRWLGTLRGRIGFATDSNPNVLWYATGGLAYAGIKTAGSESFFLFVPAGPVTIVEAFSTNENKTKFGAVLGAGMEAAIGNNWTWKMEFLHVDLGNARGAASWPGSITVCAPLCGAPIPTTSTGSYSHRMTDNIVRIGLNYRFGDPGLGKSPLVAKN